jgi:GT2 family glycosyltransferase
VIKLVFPRVSRPAVSIAIVTHGAERWVRRALSAILDHTEPYYEVILVDNASPRGMVRRLEREVENVRLVRNETNRGFGPANNQAACLAAAPVLVFLNSDALVHEGWLSFLRERLESGPDVGAAAPRLLNLDGTLQEAGALLFGNGYTQFVGYGDDPAKPSYRFPREVDYASAACLMVRARAFSEVGGFAAEYAPAYYEDVDLCLELRRRGYRTLYEPRAVVTHVRGASGEPELAKRLWLRNHPIFFARWKEFLATRPEHTPEDGDPRLQAAARDAPALGRILLATRKFPGPPPAGDPRGAELARWLAHAYPWTRRTLLSESPAPGAGVVDELLGLGWEIADAGAIAQRPFHYDAVILRGLESPHVFDLLLEAGEAALIRDANDSDLVQALAAAGVPAQNLAPPAALAKTRPILQRPSGGS